MRATKNIPPHPAAPAFLPLTPFPSSVRHKTKNCLKIFFEEFISFVLRLRGRKKKKKKKIRLAPFSPPFNSSRREWLKLPTQEMNETGDLFMKKPFLESESFVSHYERYFYTYNILNLKSKLRIKV